MGARATAADAGRRERPTRRWRGRHLPERAVLLVVSLLAVPVGVFLALRPFVSLAVLVVSVVVGLVVLGVGLLVADRPARGEVAPWWWVPGVAHVAAGVLVALWPAPTIQLIAWAVGVALAVDGVLDLLAARRATGSGRMSAVLGGITSLVLSVLALTWQDVTVLVVAVLVGLRVLLAGLRGVAAAVRGWRPAPLPRAARRTRPGTARLAGHIVALTVTLALVAVSIVVHRTAHRPDDFYTWRGDLPSAAGRLLRAEPFSSREIPDDAVAWRVLYTTTRAPDERPVVASGLVVAPRSATGADGIAVDAVTWAHGTTGITPGCAPSVMANGFASGSLYVLDDVLAEGWAVIAPDYTGLGTAGPHAYLVGDPSGRDVLDAVRAAQQLDDVSLTGGTVVWGHSQGGSAALWTGIVAPQYAPELDLRGVAALAPASNGPDLVANLPQLRVGALFEAYLVEGYARTYEDVTYADVVRPGARIAVREMAARCLADTGVLVSALTSYVLQEPIWANPDPYTGAFGRRLEQNSPDGPIEVPLLVAQGTRDSVVLARAQDAYVEHRCAMGYPVDYRLYDGLEHLELVSGSSPLIRDLMVWTRQRFAGQAAYDGCS